MRWPGVQPFHHLQPGRRDGGQQIVTRPQSKVFGEVGEDKPALTARLKMVGEFLQEAEQHPAPGVVDGVVQAGMRCGRNPGRVAHDERCPPGREHVGQDGLSTVLDAEVPEILRGAGDSTRFIVRRHHAVDATARQDGSEHTGAGPDVERQRVSGQRGGGHKIHILIPCGKEGAVVREDAVLQSVDVDAIPPPFVGADGAHKLLQGHHGGFADVTVRCSGGLPDVRCAAQRHHGARFKGNQQQAENACTVRGGLAVPVELFGRSS